MADDKVADDRRGSGQELAGANETLANLSNANPPITAHKRKLEGGLGQLSSPEQP